MNNTSLTILALESSTATCSVALWRQGAVLAVKRVTGRGQAEAIIPAIAAVMATAGRDWADIGLIAVSVGPGSFTGLRIGLSAARGLALARRLPLAGVNTADLLAFPIAADLYRQRSLLVAIDSKREDLFVQAFGPQQKPISEIRALTVAQTLAWQSGPLLVVGDAAEQFRERRADIEVSPSVPDAVCLAELAESRFSAGTALPANPLYLRPPDVTAPAR